MLSPTMQAAGWKEALEGFVTQRAWHCRSCHQCEIRKGLDKLTVGIRAGGVVRCSARSPGEQIAQLCLPGSLASPEADPAGCRKVVLRRKRM